MPRITRSNMQQHNTKSLPHGAVATPSGKRKKCTEQHAVTIGDPNFAKHQKLAADKWNK